LFKAAIRRGLYRESNPFDGMAAAVRSDKTRQFFVGRTEAQKVLDACPDAEWRLLVALARFGGLRTRSESLALRWGDIDFERGRIRVPSPKTAHHQGGDSRIIPMFAELRPLLLEVFSEAEPGSEYVITRYRDGACNLRTQLGRIIRKAGLVVWAKPWHNMRATRQTELAERYPIHVVCAWIGNSRAVAQEHYLQVTDDHFEKAAQNPAQSEADSTRTEQSDSVKNTANHPELAGDAMSRDSLHYGKLPPAGIEPARPIKVIGF